MGRRAVAAVLALALAALVAERSVTAAKWSETDAALFATPAASPADAAAVEITGLVERPGLLTVPDLRQLPVETVEVSFEVDGSMEQHTFTGVRLYDVLKRVGVVADPGDRTPLLRRYLIVTAKDGYSVVLSGGEIDPEFGNVPMLLAWERDGHTLAGDEGPVQLVVPGDKRISR